ncbi:MAG: hypothetical protein HRU38_03550 [Saccharospirillaceae bacterium]|nr:YiaA/YiaB family protein [Pseudomonadales bacterium]NRB77738.1 hypothetical protein [Saccharospirillaceae bacterium]
MTQSKTLFQNKPTKLFIGIAWFALFIGIAMYLIGLWNVKDMQLNEKGFYLTVLLFALHSVISLQKNVRDKIEGKEVNSVYEIITWAAVCTPILFLIIGLYNANLLLSEKGFYAIAFFMSMFAAITIQKNTRDLAFFAKHNPKMELDTEEVTES